MSEQVKAIQCEMTPLVTPGDPTPDTTHVGQKYSVECSGELQGFNTVRNPKIVDKNYQWTPKLKLLDVKAATDANIEFVAITYVPGDNNSDDLYLFDGAETMQISGLKWEVASVLPPPGPAQQVPKPYPSYGPALMSFAWYYWLLLGIILCFLGWFFYSYLRKAKQKKALLEELRAHQTALTPFDQFFKDVRYLERDLDLDKLSNEEFYKKLSDYFLLYLVREFEVPAQKWSNRDIMSGIRKVNKNIYREIRSDLARLLKELRRGESAKLKKSDCDYLLKLSQSIVETTEEIKDQVG